MFWHLQQERHLNEANFTLLKQLNTFLHASKIHSQNPSNISQTSVVCAMCKYLSQKILKINNINKIMLEL